MRRTGSASCSLLLPYRYFLARRSSQETAVRLNGSNISGCPTRSAASRTNRYKVAGEQTVDALLVFERQRKFLDGESGCPPCCQLRQRDGKDAPRQLSQSWMCPYNVWHLSCVLWIIWISELRSQCCEHRSEEGQLLLHAKLRSRDHTCPLGFRSGASASTARSAEEIIPVCSLSITRQISR
jgi:hypothetical protein